MWATYLSASPWFYLYVVGLWLLVRHPGTLLRLTRATAIGLGLAGLAVPVVTAFAVDRGPRPSNALPITRIVNARVVDPESGLLPGLRTIVIANGTIVRVDDASTAHPAPDRQSIDAAGGFVVPGLIDVHAHLQVPAASPRSFSLSYAGGEIFVVYGTIGRARTRLTEELSPPRSPQRRAMVCPPSSTPRSQTTSGRPFAPKPIRPERLAAALERLRAAAPAPLTTPAAEPSDPARLERVFVRDGDRCWLIPVTSIALFESEGNYTRVCFDGHRPLVRTPLHRLEARLDPAAFFRASRTHIVNLRFVERVEQGVNDGLVVCLHQLGDVSVSRRQARRLRDAWSLDRQS